MSTQNQSVHCCVLLHVCEIWYSVNPSVYLCKMARRRNKIAVEWLESKDKAQINCVNIKHVLEDLSCAAEGTEVIVKFSFHCYEATIIEFLEWQPERGTERAGTPVRATNRHGAVQSKMKLRRAA